MTGTEQCALIREALDAADRRAAALAATSTPEAWATRTPEGGWSPSECVQHLVLSVDAMLARMDPAIADGRTRDISGNGPFSPGLLGRLLLWALEPPYRRLRSRTAPAFVPASTRAPEADVAALHAAHDRVRESLARASGLALDRLSIVSPFDARASYNLYAAFAILPVHARRHLWQAEQAIAARRA